MIAASLFLIAAALPGTVPLQETGDLAAAMVDSIDRYLTRRLHALSGQSTAPPPGTRERFRHLIGLRDQRLPPAPPEKRRQLTQTPTYTVFEARWSTLPGVDAEGLLVEPARPASRNCVLLPDADQTPEQAFSERGQPLLDTACRILIPVLIDRADTWSGNPSLRMTNQPHREYIYRMAYQAGRHIIGYEVQKVLAAIDGFKHSDPAKPVTVSGYGEGGLLALYSAAADERIDRAIVAGYFSDRTRLWQQPIYRNVWSLLDGFSDAQLAALVQPRELVIEAGTYPQLPGPPPERPGRKGAAPGELSPPPIEEVRRELQKSAHPTGRLVENPALRPLAAVAFDGVASRQERQFRQLVAHSQSVVREAERSRKAAWSAIDMRAPGLWQERQREAFHRDLIGRLPDVRSQAPAASRKLYDTPMFDGYEVRLPMAEELFAYGILLVPKGMKPGERRPAVVAQHGLEGRPQHLIAPATPDEFRVYQRFAARLAERGFVVYAPQNPYIGGNRFRQLSRKSQPLGLTLFSFITAQHSRTLDWLQTLPFIDGDRIGYYGLSYGGATAMRVPPLEPRYKAVVCSGNFNEWSWKITTDEQPFTYLLTGEYEIYEFNQTNTFGHFEMVSLIAPRPFMVERGHADGVGIDEWVAYEYAKVRRLYALWGIPDSTQIEYFNGVHQIWGNDAFTFLHRHLHWP